MLDLCDLMCEFCDGSGECQRCHGTGQLESALCPDCHGMGLCLACEGSGEWMSSTRPKAPSDAPSDTQQQ